MPHLTCSSGKAPPGNGAYKGRPDKQDPASQHTDKISIGVVP